MASAGFSWRWGVASKRRLPAAAVVVLLGASSFIGFTEAPTSAVTAAMPSVSQIAPHTHPGLRQVAGRAAKSSAGSHHATGGTPAGRAVADVTPSPPTVTADQSEGFSLHPTFTVTDIDPGATLDCSVTEPAGGPTVAVSSCDVSSGLDLSGGDDGTYTLSVTQTDSGETSAAGTATYQLDVSTPTITADSAVGAGAAPTFTVTNIDSGTTLECSVSDPALATVTTCGPTTSLDLGGAPDGTYTVTVDAKDASGDTSASASDSYEFESNPPPAPAVTAPSAAGNDRSPSFTVTDAENVNLTYHCTVPSLGAGAITTCGPTTTLNLTTASDRSYTLRVTATDELGQTSPLGTASYILDTSTPVPVVTRISPASSPSTVTAPTYSITDSESLDGPDTFSCVWTAPDGMTVSSGACSSGDSFPTAGHGDGRYTLRVTATDGAGNTATAAAVRYTLETGAPPAPVVVAAQSTGTGRTPSFTVTDAENVTLTYSCAIAGLPNSDITSCGPTTTLNLAGAPEGNYQLSVTVTDGLGHVSAAGIATYALDLSTPAPVVTLVAPLLSPSANTAPSFSITDAESLDGPDTFSCVWTRPSGPAVSSPSCASGDTFAADAGDGPYTLTVTATDTLGNSVTAQPVTYELETSAPPAPVVTTAPPFGNDLTPTFTVTDAENVDLTYDCSVAGLPSSAITTCGPTTALDLTGEADGTYTLVVTVTDGLGQTSPTGSADYTLDTSTPVPAVILRPPLISPSTSTTATFTITDAESVDGPDTFSCVWHRPVGPAVTRPSCSSGPSFAANAGDGNYTLTVTATDRAGNIATAPAVTYALDTTPPPTPTVALTSPATSPGNDTSPQFTVTDPDTSPGSGLSYACTVTGPTTVLASQIDCDATTTLDLSGAGRDGRYRLTVTTTDAAGNTSLPSVAASYTLDATAPVTPTVALTTPATSPGNVTMPRFAVTDVDHSPGAGLTFDCSVTGATPVPPSAVTCGTTTTLDLRGAGRDGTYTLSVTATDAAGNTSTAGTASYVLDTMPPGAPDVTMPGPSTKLPAFGISDSNPNVTLTCLLLSPKGTTVFATAPCPAGGIFNTTAFGDGNYTLTVTATTPSRNTASTTVVWLRDTTPPPAPTVTLSSPSSSPSVATNPQFSVSDTDASPVPGLTFSCAVTGPTAVPASAVSCGVPTTSVDLSGTGRDGTYTLAVTATDSAGNTSTTGIASYALDTIAPAAPTVSLSAPTASPGNLTEPLFSVSDSDSSPGHGLTYTCSVSGPTAVPPTAIICGAPTTPIDLSGAGRDGTYTLSVTATDAAGNVSATAGTASYTLDTTPPPAPTVTLSAPTASPGHLTDPSFSVSDPDVSPGAGLTYTCLISGPTVVPSSAISCGAPATSVDLSGTGRDGIYTLAVTAIDAAGNASLTVGTAMYTLDTTAPLPPVVGLATATRSSSLTPLWTWQFGFNDIATDQDIATCLVTGPNGWTTTRVGCGHHLSPILGGGDGNYALTVTLTDEAGNTSSADSPAYTLDSQAPAGPTVFLRHPSSGTGLSRNPVWAVSGPPGSTLKCTLLQGGHAGTPVAPEATCTDPVTFNLSGLADGLFTLRVVAVDAANNSSFPAWSQYALAPAAPHVRAPHSESPTAIWTVTGNPRDTYICTLTHRGKIVVGPHTCDSSPTYHMASFEPGDYTLSVVQVGAAGVRSAAGSATWTWDGVPKIPPTHPTRVPPTGHHPDGGAVVPRHHPKPPPPRGIPAAVGGQIHRVSRTAPVIPTIYPSVHPNRVSEAVASAVQGVVQAVGAAGAGTGFPLLLLGLVLAFLIAQNRIDRRDPKLALASVAADDMVEFQLPPSRRDWA